MFLGVPLWVWFLMGAGIYLEAKIRRVTVALTEEMLRLRLDVQSLQEQVARQAARAPRSPSRGRDDDD